MTIWDPLRRRQVAATPEEQVRQWFIKELETSFKVPAHMMMSEVGFRFSQKQYRADILVYDRCGQPLVIVECKRPSVEITPEVAAQAMRYDAVLSVKYIVLTNGTHTYMFSREESGFRPVDHLPQYEEMICRQ